jgi:pimeloyl-ACP methyl ester carboxylesterase
MVADHRRERTIEAAAARILDAAPPAFALAGLSMGGYLAFAMMRQAPERVKKLALLDTSARADTPEQSAVRERLVGMAEDGRLPDVVAMLETRFIHPARHSDEALRRTIRDMAADTGPEAFVRQEQAIMSRPDSRPLLPSIRCPTLVLVGAEDELTPPFLAEEIAHGIPGARLVVVPDCGHLSTLERPEAVNEALAAWLAA